MTNFETITQPSNQYRIHAICHTNDGESTHEFLGLESTLKGSDAALGLARAILQGNVPIDCDRIVQVDVFQIVREIHLMEAGHWDEMEAHQTVAKGADIEEFNHSIEWLQSREVAE